MFGGAWRSECASAPSWIRPPEVAPEGRARQPPPSSSGRDHHQVTDGGHGTCACENTSTANPRLCAFSSVLLLLLFSLLLLFPCEIAETEHENPLCTYHAIGESCVPLPRPLSHNNNNTTATTGCSTLAQQPQPLQTPTTTRRLTITSGTSVCNNNKAPLISGTVEIWLLVVLLHGAKCYRTSPGEN